MKIKEILVILAYFPILTFSTAIITSLNSFPEVEPLLSDTRDYWPTQEWLNATPESKGMASKKLNHMIDVLFIAISLSFIPGLISIIVLISVYWIAKKRSV